MVTTVGFWLCFRERLHKQKGNGNIYCTDHPAAAVISTRLRYRHRPDFYFYILQMASRSALVP